MDTILDKKTKESYLENDVNSILLEGVAVKDPSLRKIGAKNTPFVTLQLANNRYYKSGGSTSRESSYFEIEAWGDLALDVEKKVKKGLFVRVTGRIKQLRWESFDKGKRQRVVLVASFVDVLEKKYNGDKDIYDYQFPKEDKAA